MDILRAYETPIFVLKSDFALMLRFFIIPDSIEHELQHLGQKNFHYNLKL